MLCKNKTIQFIIMNIILLFKLMLRERIQEKGKEAMHKVTGCSVILTVI